MIKRGLYLITANHPGGFDATLNIVASAIQGGVVAVQYRNKHDTPLIRHTEALQLLTLCQHHQVPLLINDDVGLAKKINANGVHLGQNDTSLKHARSKLGENKIIGITCHSSIELARTAQQDSANYVAFGRFFASRTKPDASSAETEILVKAHATLDIPIVAIGGINAENAGELIRAGADLVAVSNDVFNAENPWERAQTYQHLF